MPTTAPRCTLFIKRCTSCRSVAGCGSARATSPAWRLFVFFGHCLSHNLNAKFQLKCICSQLASAINALAIYCKLQIANAKIENWNLIALFCKWANGKWGNCGKCLQGAFTLTWADRHQDMPHTSTTYTKSGRVDRVWMDRVLCDICPTVLLGLL